MTAVFAFSFLILAVEFIFRFRRAREIVAQEKAARGF